MTMMKRSRWNLALGALVLLTIATAARAELRLAPLFVDGAVLQREKPVAVWGWADPGQAVTVAFHDQKVDATADAKGRWQATLSAMPAHSDNAVMTISARSETLTIKDVLVGDVWMCSGQSNMQWTVRQSLNAEQEMAAANFPLIRHYRVPQVHAIEPVDTFKAAKWVPATPTTVGPFSGVAYFFARDIHRALDVPVGLINTSWGGKMIEVFISADALAAHPAEFKKIFNRWEQEQGEVPKKLEEYKAKLAAYQAAPDKSPKPSDPQWVVDQHRPSCVYNGLVAPCIPYGIRGVIWYQGEHNISRASEYPLQFATMIADWRQKFGQRNMPFYFCQLSSYEAPLDKSREGFAQLREAQLKSLSIENTGMAVTIDVGTPANVHPPDKQTVGGRLARVAKAKTYNLGGEWSGPALRSATRLKEGVRLSFEHADGLTLRSDASFEVAGADGKFKPAAASVVGSEILLACASPSDVKMIRYAWANAPTATLFNGAGLPASPFRYTLAD
jgi:sialate O-acetylesterase